MKSFDLDNWLISQVQLILEFLLEWLGISQRLIERGLIIIYSLSSFIMWISLLLKTKYAVYPASPSLELFLCVVLIFANVALAQTASCSSHCQRAHHSCSRHALHIFVYVYSCCRNGSVNYCKRPE